MLEMISHFGNVRDDISVFLGLSVMAARWLPELSRMSMFKGGGRWKLGAICYQFLY